MRNAARVGRLIRYVRARSCSDLKHEFSLKELLFKFPFEKFQHETYSKSYKLFIAQRPSRAASVT